MSYSGNKERIINRTIGETKRFRAKEIFKRLKLSGRTDLLRIMRVRVSENEQVERKLHNVFMPLEDIKELLSFRRVPARLVVTSEKKTMRVTLLRQKTYYRNFYFFCSEYHSIPKSALCNSFDETFRIFVY